MTRFAKLSLSLATALSLALAPVPAAAEPDGEDIARVLAGLAILGIIAKAASDNDDDRRRTRARSATRYGSIDDYRDRRVIEGEIINRDYRKTPKGKGYKKAKLPDRCLRIIDTARGDRLVYGARCLNRNYRHASKLPQRCERLVRTNRGVRTVYATRCLARDGWRVARR